MTLGRIQSSMATDAMEPLKKQLKALLEGGQAHAGFEDAVKDFPVDKRSVVPENLPYSAWQLLEHMRITQKDILDFCAPPTGGYQPLEWPKDYWPESPEPPYPGSWDNTVAAIRNDLEKFQALVASPTADLFKPFRWGQGQNLLREALLIADHSAYHLGEIVLLRRLLGIWKKS
jgi:hypothetical protein